MHRERARLMSLIRFMEKWFGLTPLTCPCLVKQFSPTHIFVVSTHTHTHIQFSFKWILHWWHIIVETRFNADKNQQTFISHPVWVGVEYAQHLSIVQNVISWNRVPNTEICIAITKCILIDQRIQLHPFYGIFKSCFQGLAKNIQLI